MPQTIESFSDLLYCYDKWKEKETQKKGRKKKKDM